MKLVIIYGLIGLIIFGLGFISGYLYHIYKELKDLAEMWWWL